MTTKEMAKKWGVNEHTVANYCKKDYIPNAKKENGSWNIPENSIKPLSIADIRRLLLVTVKLRNNPSLGCDWSTFDFDKNDLRLIYESLHYRKYIGDISDIDTNRIPYEMEITEKGMELIENIKEENVDFTQISSLAFQAISFIIALLQNKR